ncbi:MAG: hypothetical protein LBU22_01095 [Dysgonamonadaceae bacterium]|jgi:hypothetical protein|nr:hypothetical protein [Dysgonamonadaceae bacterium]
MGNAITIYDNEIHVNLFVKKDTFLTLVLTVFPFVGLVSLAYVLGGLNSIIFSPLLFFILGLLVSDFTIKGFFWRMFGSRLITFDRKYIIIYETQGVKSVQKVFKMSDVKKIEIDFNYNITIWTRIRSFWNRDDGGCICLDYNDKRKRIGYGLTVQEAKELLLILKENNFFET